MTPSEPRPCPAPARPPHAADALARRAVLAPGLPAGLLQEARAAHAALAGSEGRLKLALECTRDGLWDMDCVSGECYFSPPWLAMLGYAPGELGTHRGACEALLHPDDAAGVRAALD